MNENNYGALYRVQRAACVFEEGIDQVNKKKFSRRLPVRIELHADENDAAAISANLYMCRDALWIEFPSAAGARLGTMKIEHHNYAVNLVYWDADAIQASDAGTVVPLFQIVPSKPSEP